MAIVLDTGVLYATLDADDQYHGPCTSLLSAVRGQRIIPAPALTEVDWLCGRRSHSAFSVVLDQLDTGALVVEDLVSADYRRVDELLKAYADLNVGFVDAAVLAVVERLREPKLATLDHRHFSVMRPRHVEALELLPA